MSYILQVPDQELASFAAGSNLGTMDAVGEKCAGVFVAPKDLSLTALDILASSLTAAGTLDVRVETVNSTTGIPTGTLWATGTEATGVSVAAAETIYTGTLGATATIPKGEIFAVVCVVPSGSSFNGQMKGPSSSNPPMILPYGIISPTYGKSSATTLMCGFSESGIRARMPHVFIPFLDTNSSTYNSSSTPDEYGLKITPGEDFDLEGIAIPSLGSASTATLDVVVYNSANTELASKAVHNGQTRSAASASGYLNIIFDTAVSLTSGQTYRVTLRPSSINNITVYRTQTYTGVTAGMLNSVLDGLFAAELTSRVNAGSWTDVAGSLMKLSLLIDAKSIGGVSGGGGGSNTPQRAWSF